MTAPVTLVTGLPGNGKTLYTLCMVKEWAEKENRQVYYHGIEILDKTVLPWIEFLDSTTWHQLPAGAIIVIDEAHKVFPVRPHGSRTPAHVEAIAELRHQGHNLILITQHPMELDTSIRRRVGRHLHAVRRFGMQACAVFEWSRCVDNCDKTRKDAIRHEWVFNKRAYSWYKSAELHTIKRRIPKKLLFLVIAPVLVAFAVWYVYSIFTKQRDASPIPAVSTVDNSASAPGGRLSPMSISQNVVSWHSDRQPRIRDLPQTAPIYDDVTKPVRAPFPAACVQTKKRCQCYTQQATPLNTSAEFCARIVAGGLFLDWDFNSGEAKSERPIIPVERHRESVAVVASADNVPSLEVGSESASETSQVSRSGGGAGRPGGGAGRPGVSVPPAAGPAPDRGVSIRSR